MTVRDGQGASFMTLDLSEPAISCGGSVGGGGVSAAGPTEGGQDQHDSVLDCRFGQSQPSPDLPVGHAFDDLKSGSVLAGVSARVLSLGLLHHGSSCCHFSRMGVVGGPGVCSQPGLARTSGTVGLNRPPVETKKCADPGDARRPAATCESRPWGLLWLSSTPSRFPGDALHNTPPRSRPCRSTIGR